MTCEPPRANVPAPLNGMFQPGCANCVVCAVAQTVGGTTCDTRHAYDRTSQMTRQQLQSHTAGAQDGLTRLRVELSYVVATPRLPGIHEPGAPEPVATDWIAGTLESVDDRICQQWDSNF